MNEEVVIRTLNHFYKKRLLLLEDEATSDDDVALTFYKNPENCIHSQGDSEIPLKQKQLLGDTKAVMENNNLCKLLRALHSMADCDCDTSCKCNNNSTSTQDCACQAPSTEDEKASSCKSFPSRNESSGVNHDEVGFVAQTTPVNESEDNPSSEVVNPSHAYVLSCIEMVMRWLERQPECNSQTLLVLKHLHDLAATKKYAELKLKSIVSFFERQM